MHAWQAVSVGICMSAAAAAAEAAVSSVERRKRAWTPYTYFGLYTSQLCRLCGWSLLSIERNAIATQEVGAAFIPAFELLRRLRSFRSLHTRLSSWVACVIFSENCPQGPFAATSKRLPIINLRDCESYCDNCQLCAYLHFTNLTKMIIFIHTTMCRGRQTDRQKTIQSIQQSKYQSTKNVPDWCNKISMGLSTHRIHWT